MINHSLVRRLLKQFGTRQRKLRESQHYDDETNSLISTSNTNTKKSSNLMMAQVLTSNPRRGRNGGNPDNPAEENDDNDEEPTLDESTLETTGTGSVVAHQVQYNNYQVLKMHRLLYDYEKYAGQDEKETIQLVDKLLKSPAGSSCLRMVDKNGQNALHVAMTINKQGKTIPIEVVLSILELYPKAAHVQDNSGYTPLHIAILYHIDSTLSTSSQSEGGGGGGSGAEMLDIIRLLLACYPEATTVGDHNFGRTPLHLAMVATRCYYNPEEIRENNQCSKQHETLASLEQALLSSFSMDVIDELLKANPNVLQLRDNDGCTPLHLMMENGKYASLSVVKFLVGCDPGVLETQDKEGRTPLHVGLRERVSLPIINLLLEKYPAATEQPDIYGNTPVQDAIFRNVNPDIILAILNTNYNKTTDETIEFLKALKSYDGSSIDNITNGNISLMGGEDSYNEKKTNDEFSTGIEPSSWSIDPPSNSKPYTAPSWISYCLCGWF